MTFGRWRDNNFSNVTGKIDRWWMDDWWSAREKLHGMDVTGERGGMSRTEGKVLSQLQSWSEQNNHFGLGLDFFFSDFSQHMKHFQSWISMKKDFWSLMKQKSCLPLLLTRIVWVCSLTSFILNQGSYSRCGGLSRFIHTTVWDILSLVSCRDYHVLLSYNRW